MNIPAESGEMGILANHVPAIEQLKPGLVEVLEEGGASKKFFRMSDIQVFDLGLRLDGFECAAARSLICSQG